MVSTEKSYLKWDYFQENIRNSLIDLAQSQDFCDVTLVCEDNQKIVAHRIVLSASSPMLQQMLRNLEHSHPLLYFWDIKHRDLIKLMEFMYRGQTSVYQSDLAEFISIAKTLAVQGISEQLLQENKNSRTGPFNILDNKILPFFMQTQETDIPSEEVYDLDKNSFEKAYGTKNETVLILEPSDIEEENLKETCDISNPNIEAFYEEVNRSIKESSCYISGSQDKEGDIANRQFEDSEINTNIDAKKTHKIINDIPQKRKKKSLVWLFFEIHEKDKVQCKKCCAKLRTGPRHQGTKFGTGDMIRHLKKCNPDGHKMIIEARHTSILQHENKNGLQEIKVEERTGKEKIINVSGSQHSYILNKESNEVTNSYQEEKLKSNTQQYSLQEQEGISNTQIGLKLQDGKIATSYLNMVNIEHKRQKGKRLLKSALWLFYETLGENTFKATCKTCGKEISRGREERRLGNGNMLPHLKRYHPDEYKRYVEVKEAQEARECSVMRPAINVLQYFEEDSLDKLLISCQVGHCTEKFRKDLTPEALKGHLFTHWNADKS